MKDTTIFKEKLLAEKALVETELAKVGRRNPEQPQDWEPVETEIDSDHADDSDVADNQESFAENQALVATLETQLTDINDALTKIENGTYGICEVSGEEIPEERLLAFPAARTTVEHAK